MRPDPWCYRRWGHFALEHTDTRDFAEYLRQRIESNYFAAAILAPEEPAVEFLREAQANDDISVGRPQGDLLHLL